MSSRWALDFATGEISRIMHDLFDSDGAAGGNLICAPNATDDRVRGQQHPRDNRVPPPTLHRHTPECVALDVRESSPPLSIAHTYLPSMDPVSDDGSPHPSGVEVLSLPPMPEPLSLDAHWVASSSLSVVPDEPLTTPVVEASHTTAPARPSRPELASPASHICLGDVMSQLEEREWKVQPLTGPRTPDSWTASRRDFSFLDHGSAPLGSSSLALAAELADDGTLDFLLEEERRLLAAAARRPPAPSLQNANLASFTTDVVDQLFPDQERADPLFWDAIGLVACGDSAIDGMSAVARLEDLDRLLDSERAQLVALRTQSFVRSTDGGLGATARLPAMSPLITARPTLAPVLPMSVPNPRTGASSAVKNKESNGTVTSVLSLSLGHLPPYLRATTGPPTSFVRLDGDAPGYIFRGFDGWPTALSAAEMLDRAPPWDSALDTPAPKSLQPSPSSLIVQQECRPLHQQPPQPSVPIAENSATVCCAPSPSFAAVSVDNIVSSGVSGTIADVPCVELPSSQLIATVAASESPGVTVSEEAAVVPIHRSELESDSNNTAAVPLDFAALPVLPEAQVPRHHVESASASAALQRAEADMERRWALRTAATVPGVTDGKLPVTPLPAALELTALEPVAAPSPLWVQRARTQAPTSSGPRAADLTATPVMGAGVADTTAKARESTTQRVTALLESLGLESSAPDRLPSVAVLAPRPPASPSPHAARRRSTLPANTSGKDRGNKRDLCTEAPRKAPVNDARHKSTPTSIEECTKMHLALLPMEILLSIFGWLAPPTLSALAQTCVYFRNVCNDASLWKCIEVRGKSSLSVESIGSIACRSPECLVFKKCTGMIAHEVTPCLKSLRLWKLSLVNCSLVDDAMMVAIAQQCMSLTSLDVSWSDVTDVGLAVLAQSLAPLHAITLQGLARVTDGGVVLLAERWRHHLVAVDVTGAHRLTDLSLAALRRCCPGLRSLRLAGCPRFTASALATLVDTAPALQSLDASGCKLLTDAVLATAAAACPQLQHVSVAHCPLVSNNGVVALAQAALPLTFLSVESCALVSDAGLVALAMHCVCLEDVNFSGTPVSDAALRALASAHPPRLTSLRLNQCEGVTVAGLREVVQASTHLRYLALRGCPAVTNSVAAALVRARSAAVPAVTAAYPALLLVIDHES